MNYEQQRERYENDPLFHSAVSTFLHFFQEGMMTVGELRDAVTFAGVLFEAHYIRRVVMKIDI